MRPKGLIVAIDGPAGAGKSTVARELARRLGYVYVDTGAMYRVVALRVLETETDPEDGGRLGEIAESVRIHFEPRPDGGQSVFADGRDVTQEIRDEKVGEWASKVSTRGEVRDRMVALQREMGAAGGVVLEGRDIGTVVFPDADLKFFLDASAEERGRRRFLELEGRGVPASLQSIVADIGERDRRDQSRSHSPLRCAADAERIDTTSLTIEGVLSHLLKRCHDKLGTPKISP